MFTVTLGRTPLVVRVTLAVIALVTFTAQRADTADRTPSFDVVTGERFAVTLPSNRTTGYQWQLGRPPDEAVVKLLGVEYRAPDRTVPGMGGSETWTFEAVGTGAATIRLNYVRPWERSAAPGRSSVFEVVVR